MQVAPFLHGWLSQPVALHLKSLMRTPPAPHNRSPLARHPWLHIGVQCSLMFSVAPQSPFAPWSGSLPTAGEWHCGSQTTLSFRIPPWQHLVPIRW